MRKYLLITLLMVLGVAGLRAQVTTSSLTGSVKDEKGEALIGASVKATHQPSGTTYGASTNVDGRFTIPTMRIGGPYLIVVSYIGQESQSFTNVNLKLGEPYLLNVTLNSSSRSLQEVVVKGTKTIKSDRIGANTNISTEMIATLPSITRSITDYTRLTPQASGNSFAGRDNRYNNIQVDGANLNNTFGTSTDPLPGGGKPPISIESFDQISVNIAPVDVRQSGFTGAGIYAVTKSGTNTFHGSAYTYFKDQSYNGTHIGDNDISANVAKSKDNVYGLTLGGPILKNKLFFFVNYETEKEETPGIAFSPKGGSGTGAVTLATVAELQQVSDYLKNKYGYETGAFDNFAAFKPEQKKYLVKLDWNVNEKNKVTLKYSHHNGTSDNQVNNTSTPNNGTYTYTNVATGVPTTRASGGLPNSRYSKDQSIAFQNSNYGFQNLVSTGTAEWNTSIGSKMSNQLLFAYKRYDNPRIFAGKVFPTIDIFNGAGTNYITAGMDPFTLHNEVIDNTTSITDNFTYYAGRHTLTGGLSYEYQRVGNAFMPGAAGSYIYNSLDDFLNDKAPIQFTYNYSLIPGQTKVFSADLRIGQYSAYAQDEFNVNRNFKFTYGLRLDKPNYLQDPVENPQMTALQLPNKIGNLISYSTGRWPKSRVIFSPRAGFRTSTLSDNSLVFRGSAGLFTGRIPYVFLTNMPSNSGMYNFGGVLSTPAQLANIKLVEDPSVYANLFPQTAGTGIQAASVVIDPNFKFPQILRTDLAVEKNLGNGFTLSLEGLLTKDVNAAVLRNANLKAPTGTITEGNNSRVRYVGTGTNNAVLTSERYIYPNLSSVIVLENTNKGYAASLTAQISKSIKGFYGSVGYTYTDAKSITSNVGSTAANVWSANPNIGTSNDLEMGYSNYYVPHRVVAYTSYTFNYLKHGATTLSLYYQGSNGGASPLNYLINGDLNGDGNSADLMYVPKTANELTFASYNATVNGITYTYTPQQQAAALEQFINNSPYLKTRRGQYAERNAAFLPWYNRIDLNFLQDIYLQTGKNKHTLEFSAVVQNFANMLNKYWGIQKNTTTTSPLTYVSIDANGVPTYNLRQLNGKLVTTPYQDATTATTWSVLLGLKYKF